MKAYIQCCLGWKTASRISDIKISDTYSFAMMEFSLMIDHNSFFFITFTSKGSRAWRASIRRLSFSDNQWIFVNTVSPPCRNTIHEGSCMNSEKPKCRRKAITAEPQRSRFSMPTIISLTIVTILSCQTSRP